MEQGNIKKKPVVGADSLGARILNVLGFGKSRNNSYKVAVDAALKEIEGLPEARTITYNDKNAILTTAEIEAIREKGRNNVCVNPDSPPSTPPVSSRSSNSHSK